MNKPQLIDRWIEAEAKIAFFKASLPPSIWCCQHAVFTEQGTRQSEIFMSEARKIVEPQLLAMKGKHE